MELKFYRVTCKCGHVGRGCYILIDFPVKAYSKKDASRIARDIPRVKHHHKDAIINCREIDYEEYSIVQKINNCDPYLKCKNIQQQRDIEDLHSRILFENKTAEKRNKRENISYKIKKQQYELIDEEYEEFKGRRGERYVFAY